MWTQCLSIYASRSEESAQHVRRLQMRDGAQNFQITQFGLSAFVWEPPAADDGGAEERGSGRYLAHTFNFWIFPRGADDRYSRRFLSQVLIRAETSRFPGDRTLAQHLL